jgi:hypothetical protein
MAMLNNQMVIYNKLKVSSCSEAFLSGYSDGTLGPFVAKSARDILRWSPCFQKWSAQALGESWTATLLLS